MLRDALQEDAGAIEALHGKDVRTHRGADKAARETQLGVREKAYVKLLSWLLGGDNCKDSVCFLLAPKSILSRFGLARREKTRW